MLQSQESLEEDLDNMAMKITEMERDIRIEMTIWRMPSKKSLLLKIAEILTKPLKPINADIFLGEHTFSNGMKSSFVYNLLNK